MILRARPRPAPSIYPTEPITGYDVIIGGSFAGLAGALQLGRARRKVTVLDTGLPRNRFAGHSEDLPGHGHKPPLDILAEARQQLARYRHSTEICQLELAEFRLAAMCTRSASECWACNPFSPLF
jgi:predicted flavoprotein YhiN